MRLSKCKCFRSLRGRLVVAYVVGLVIVAAAVSALFMRIFVWPDDQTGRHRLLMDTVSKMAWRLDLEADGTPSRIVLQNEWKALYDAFPRDIEFRVVDAQGLVVARVHPRQQLLPVGFQSPPTVGAVDLQIDGAAVQLATVQVPGTPAGRPYFMQAAVSQRITALANMAARKPVRGSLLVTMLVSIPVLIGLMLLALKSLLRPLRETSEAAARIQPRNLSERLPTDHVPAELVPLITAFNQALERLEHGYRTQQQFLAAAAHELKTPLTLMRGQIELEGTADRATLLMDIDMMARQVHQLLHLAEASEARNYKTEVIPVAAVAMEAIGFLSRMADRSQVQLDLHLPVQAVHWQGDHGALFTLLKNLLENAIQHSAIGGVITLIIDATGLSVRDEGQGIAPELLPHLFERFWRGPRPDGSAPQGAGLGLSICHEIAMAHGWALQAVASPVGALFRLDTAANQISR